MRLKLQLLAPSQAETPITTVVAVGKGEPYVQQYKIQYGCCTAMIDRPLAEIQGEGLTD